MGLLQEAQLARLTAQHMRQAMEGRERWYGIRVPQTATQWSDEASLTPYRAISGNGDFGTDPNDEALVMGSADTPIFAGYRYFDAHALLVVMVSHASPYVFRYIWGTGTMAAAEAAGQYTDIMYVSVTVSPAATVSPVTRLLGPPVEQGTQVWIRVKNATDNAWLDFVVGTHAHQIK